MSILASLVTVFTALLVSIYVYFQWCFQFWKRKGVPQLKPSFPFGNRNIQYSFGEDVYNICTKARAKGWDYYGIYIMAKPYFIPFDLELVKAILSKDFNHFTDRGLYMNEKDDPLSAHLFTLGGSKWKKLRTRFTPNFTPAKMKMMFPTLLACGEIFENFLKTHNINEPLEVKSVLYRFGMNVIGSCAFGIDCNTFTESGSSFEYYGNRIFYYDTKRRLLYAFTNAFPNISRALGLPNLNNEVANFFFDFVQKTVDYREKNNVTRKDFMQLLIDMKRNGLNDGNPLSMEEIAAQCFIFFAAGYETSSAAATFALYELAVNQDIQERVREELNTVLTKYNGQLTYDGMNEMTYLKQVMDETLRKYPVGPLTTRVCNEDYKIPGTDIILKKGTDLIIPIKAIHWNENIYKDPWIFDPERFSPENKGTRHQYAYIPFGDGPRICIGLLFGVLEFKLAIIKVLRKYRLRLNPKTQSPLKINPTALVQAPDGGVWLDLEII